jgi:hypothetical protein
MRTAIKIIFCTITIHKCCQRHIMRKARDHLGVLYKSIKWFRNELTRYQFKLDC